MKHPDFLIVMVLVGGMALAQTSSSGTNTQTPGQNPNSQSQTMPNRFPTSQQTLRGCLRQSGNNWTISQSGQETALIGDSSLLSPHEGEQVEVQGTQPIGGPVQVTSVIKIYRYCIGQSSTPTPAPSSSSTDAQSTVKPATRNQSDGATKSQGSTNTTPSATDQTANPSNPPAQPAGSQTANERLDRRGCCSTEDGLIWFPHAFQSGAANDPHRPAFPSNSWPHQRTGSGAAGHGPSSD